MKDPVVADDVVRSRDLIVRLVELETVAVVVKINSRSTESAVEEKALPPEVVYPLIPVHVVLS